MPAATKPRSSSAARVSRHRQAMRDLGLRPIQLWVPDTRSPEFLDACRREMALIAISDAKDPTLYDEMDANIADVEGWTA